MQLPEGRVRSKRRPLEAIAWCYATYRRSWWERLPVGQLVLGTGICALAGETLAADECVKFIRTISGGENAESGCRGIRFLRC